MIVLMEMCMNDNLIRDDSGLLVQNDPQDCLEALRDAPIGIYTSTLEGRFLSVNPAMARMFGYDQPHALICAITDIASQVYVDPSDRTKLIRLIEDHGKAVNYECRFRRRDESVFWVSESIRAVWGADGCVKYYQGFVIDITDRKRYEEKLKYLSLHDQLTGLYNRTYLENEMARLSQSREHPITIISIDLDGLKPVNDMFGHEQGDMLLKNGANLLRQVFRASDILARAGGDEFVVLLPKTDAAAGKKLIRRIRSSLRRYNREKPDSRMPLSFSIGMAVAENPGMDFSEVFRQADDLMYRDKLSKNATVRSQIMRTVLVAMEERNLISCDHARRIRELCRRFGESVGLSGKQLSDLAFLAQVHDLGNVGIPDRILFKKEPLTTDEWEVVYQHPEKGCRIAQTSADLTDVADLILKHHEHWNGNGYPLGLAGEEIPIECRVFSIVDAFVSMTANKPYRKAMSLEDAKQEIRRCSGTQFDPVLVEQFMQAIELRGL